MPLVAYMSAYLVAPDAPIFMVQTLIPVPILQVLGLIIVFRESPVEKDERIWKTTDDRMWFDDESERLAPRIKIPISYVLKSRIKVFLNRSEYKVMKADPRKADWAREEEVW